ncbi:TorD/DmsD family molecular chaperone [Candidatus Pyrohabitans sp.]
MPKEPRDIFERNDYIKWYYDPELAKDWKNLLKKYSYLFWIHSMNVKDRDHWIALIEDKKPNIQRTPATPHDAASYAELAVARRDAYFQIFRAFTEISAKMAEEVLSGEYMTKLRSALSRIVPEEQLEEHFAALERFREAFANMKPKKFRRELEAERFTIFDDDLMPYISGHESVYRSEKQIMGDLTAEVKNLYREAGYVLDKSRGNLPPDEAKLELEFAFRLLEDEIEAWKAGDRESALLALERQKRFIQEHMILWLPYLFDDVANDDFKVGIALKYHGDVRDVEKYKSEEIVEMDFYRSMAKLAKLYLEHEYRQVEEMLNAARKLSTEELRSALAGVPKADTSGESTYFLRMEKK